MWACIYTTIGFAILAALGLEPWMFPLALAIVITVLVIVTQLRERRINRETAENTADEHRRELVLPSGGGRRTISPG